MNKQPQPQAPTSNKEPKQERREEQQPTSRWLWLNPDNQTIGLMDFKKWILKDP